MKITIYSDSFSPVTFGHLDIINRARKAFGHLIATIPVNPNKHVNFTVEKRVNMFRRTTAGMLNIEIVGFEDLLTDYVRIRSAAAVVKGLRVLSGFEYEFQMALADKKLNLNLETLFLTIRTENMYLSPSIVKQVANFDGDISNFVLEYVLDDITQRLYTGGKKR